MTKKYVFEHLPPVKERKLVWRILPRTFIGISLMLLMFSLGALSAVITLYYRFDFGLEQTRNDTQDAILELQIESQLYNDNLVTQRDRLTSAVNNLDGSIATPLVMNTLADDLNQSVVEIRTEDTNGNTIVFTGLVFSVDASNNETYILTSSTLLESSKTSPGPSIKVLVNEQELLGTLENWDDNKDLALIKIQDSTLQTVEWERTEWMQTNLYSNVYVASGYSNNNVLIIPNRLIDYASFSFRLSEPVANEQAGGGVFTPEGKLLGVVTKFANETGVSDQIIPFVATRESICDSFLTSC